MIILRLGNLELDSWQVARAEITRAGTDTAPRVVNIVAGRSVHCYCRTGTSKEIFSRSAVVERIKLRKWVVRSNALMISSSWSGLHNISITYLHFNRTAPAGSSSVGQDRCNSLHCFCIAVKREASI